MEKKVVNVGFYDSGTGKHQSNTVYSYKGMIPAITTIEGGGTQQIKVLKQLDMEKQNDIILGTNERTNERDYYTRSDWQHRQAEQRQHEGTERKRNGAGTKGSCEQRTAYGSENMEKRTRVIAQMDNTVDHTLESANRIYSKQACSPTVNTCGGGGLQPKVIKQWKRKLR